MKTSNSLLFVFFIIVLTFCKAENASAQTNSDNFVIMIDPGHGGRDSGTPGTGRYKTTEKDIALDVSLAFGKMLKQNLSNIDIVYTRSRDVFPTLNGRAKVANDKDVDLFISIHCNKSNDSDGHTPKSVSCELIGKRFHLLGFLVLPLDPQSGWPLFSWLEKAVVLV